MKSKVVIIDGPQRTDWREDELDLDDLAALQKIVGGYIEPLYLPYKYMAFVNEEGDPKLLNLPITCVVKVGVYATIEIHGPVIFIGDMSGACRVLKPFHIKKD